MAHYDNVICPFCGCVCDDIEILTENNKIVNVKRGCAISTDKFLHCLEHRIPNPVIRVNGNVKEANLSDALDKAAEILAKSKYPLLYGWSCTSSEAIKAGVELAEELGGVMDNTSTVCHAPGLEAVQDVGEVGATLGQIKHRADLVVYWGCNPTQAHPRHFTRYSINVKGKWREGKKARKSILVDVRKTPSSKIVDKFVQVQPGKDLELITALRMAARDEEFETDCIAGVPVSDIEEMADMMVNCELGIVFFGLGLTHSIGKSENIVAAIQLVIDLNAKTKFLIMPMRGHFNVAGANKVLSWQMGYPFAVDFSHGYPRYNPGETSTVELLSREEFDAAIVVASDPMATMPQQIAANLAKIPLIVVDPAVSATSLMADIHIPSTFIGIESEGTVYRMDGVPLLMKKVLEPPPNCLPDTEILKELLVRVRKLKRGS